MIQHNNESHDEGKEKAGLVFGGLAVLFWATSSSLIVLGGSSMSVWTFISLAAVVAAFVQLAIYRAQGGNLKLCFFLPWRLWLGGILIFTVYGLAYPAALTFSVSPSQQLAVNLMNYLWPVLTVVFSVLWVPGIRMTPRLFFAILLAVAGLILANVASIREVFSAGDGGVWPYVLGATAAVTWGLYSSLLARWRSWANLYQTAPLGILCIGLLAGIIGYVRGEWRWPTGGEWLYILAYSLFPWGLGYMLWEKALHRANAGTLGVFGATIPVTSTLLLCVVQRHYPSATTLIAAVVMTAAVLLTVKRRNGLPPEALERID